jgi:hypothetical protein
VRVPRQIGTLQQLSRADGSGRGAVLTGQHSGAYIRRHSLVLCFYQTSLITLLCPFQKALLLLSTVHLYADIPHTDSSNLSANQ